MFHVNVSPDMGMYNILPSQSYDMSYALAEFVDNSIQAFQMYSPERYKAGPALHIKLRFYSASYTDEKLRNTIIIEDDGPGIDRHRLNDAFKPAKPVSATGLSGFGIGMKAAAVWFTDTWRLTTQPQREAKRYEFAFNLQELLAAGSDTVAVEEVASSSRSSGTTVTLSGTRQTINKARFDQIKRDLTEIYQKFTEGAAATIRLEMEFDGTPYPANFSAPSDRETLRAEAFRSIGGQTYAIGPKRDWRLDLAFVFHGQPVHGELRLLRTGSYTDNPGIVLLRHNRVISGTSRQPYIPQSLMSTANKYARQRVYGELHMDGLRVSYTKDRFLFEDEEFVSALRANEGVDELVRQATEYRLDPDKIKFVKSERDLEKKVGKEKAKRARERDRPGKSTPKTAKPLKPATKPPEAPVVGLLNRLKPHTDKLIIQTLIEETISQYQAHRSIAAALCLRVVLEAGVLLKIERRFPGEYSKVSDKGIRSLLNYMKNHASTFFTPADYRVEQCVKQNAAGGDENDVVLLNFVSHGHYHPDNPAIDRKVSNLQALLEWAFIDS